MAKKANPKDVIPLREYESSRRERKYRSIQKHKKELWLTNRNFGSRAVSASEELYVCQQKLNQSHESKSL